MITARSISASDALRRVLVNWSSSSWCGAVVVAASGCILPPHATGGGNGGSGEASTGIEATTAARPVAPELGGPMVFVPGATFPMRCDPLVDAICNDGAGHPHLLSERPLHMVTVSDYFIDVHEVTLGAYDECVASGACTPSGSNWPECNTLAVDHEQHPVDCVTWAQGDAFCAWAGKRLPTEAEWEYAARSDDQRIYPWGNQPPDCSRANIHANEAGCGTLDTFPVGSLPLGDSPFGLADLSGNVAEFVADHWSEDYYEVSPSDDPTGPTQGSAHVLRGGGYNFPLEGWLVRATSRTEYGSNVPSPQIGFRCAADISP